MKKLLGLFLMLGVLLMPCVVEGALSKTTEAVGDWVAIGQNAIVEGTTLNVSDHYATELHIQAFLDSVTAHTGSIFIIQVSGNDTGDEDWAEYTRFTALVGTANTEPIDDNPLTAASTTITISDTGGNYEADEPIGKWLAIEGATLVNSELVWQTAFTQDSDITIMDGTTNEHAVSVALFDIAISRTITIGFPVYRCRVIFDNTGDNDGSTLNAKVRAVAVTGI